MSQIFDLLFSCFERIVLVMRTIEVFDGVSLLSFCIGILIMSIVIVGILNVVRTGPTNAQGYYSREKNKASERERRKQDRRGN